MAENIMTLTDAEFETQVIKATQPTLVDFWAEWCAPCRALGPVIEEVAKASAGKLRVGKMNIDDHPNTPGKYGVRSIPTLLLFKDGAVVGELIGLSTRAKIEELVAKHS